MSQLAYPGFPVCPVQSPSPEGIVPCYGTASSALAAVLVRADAYADALAAAPLAEQRYGPILLTYHDRLHPATADELLRLVDDAGLEQVVLLGGTRALSSQVEQQVRDLGFADVRRVAGTDRFQTAAQLAKALVSPEQLGHVPSSPPFEADTVLVARGSGTDEVPGWPDALSAASLATWLETPLLLVQHDSVPAATRQVLEELGVQRVIIVGGAAAVSGQVEAELAAIVGQVSRIGGATRYSTSRLVADRIVEDFGTAGGLAFPRVVDGRDWPDALAAAPTIGGAGALVMIDGQDLDGSPATRDWLDEHAAEFEEVRLVGGPNAVTPEVEEALRALLRP